ncbi:MAG: extracellular solute-binding protein, partial [Chloroflexi bacterium]
MKRWLRPITSIVAALVAVTACGGGTPSAGGSTQPSAATQDTELIFYSGGDTNVQDLHQKQIIPAFEKATGIKVTFTFLEHGTGAQGIYDRIKAQKDAGKTQWDIDLWESDTGYYTRPDDLFLQVGPSDIANLSKVPKPTLDFVQNKAVPYRGSSVVLAYNSDKVANPPQTYDDLLTWIKANPGKFAYNEPSTGGSGDAFVIAM